MCEKLTIQNCQKVNTSLPGGFPCQPHSLAGNRQGDSDKRDLWPECARMLRELRPKIAVFENVPGLFVSNRGRFFNGVLSDISESGYNAEWQIVSAKNVGAPHLRKRVWIVAYSSIWEPRLPAKQEGRQGSFERSEKESFPDPDCEGLQGRLGGVLQECSGEWLVRKDGSSMADSENKLCIQRRETRPGWAGLTNCDNVFSNADNAAPARLGEYGGQIYAGAKAKEFRERCCAEWWSTEPDVGRVADGVPARVDRLKGLGNAVVPQCIETIFNYPVFDFWRINADNNK